VLGRLRRGVLGRVQDGAFRPLPADAPAHCGDLSREPLMAVMEREAGPSRTVVYGVSAGRESVVVTVAGSRTRVRTAALGTFVLVRPGARAGDESGARVSATVDGRQIVVRLD
jgi:hypothetical protein